VRPRNAVTRKQGRMVTGCNCPSGFI